MKKIDNYDTTGMASTKEIKDFLRGLGKYLTTDEDLLKMLNDNRHDYAKWEYGVILDTIYADLMNLMQKAEDSTAFDF